MLPVFLHVEMEVTGENVLSTHSEPGCCVLEHEGMYKVPGESRYSVNNIYCCYFLDFDKREVSLILKRHTCTWKALVCLILAKSATVIIKKNSARIYELGYEFPKLSSFFLFKILSLFSSKDGFLSELFLQGHECDLGGGRSGSWKLGLSMGVECRAKG